MLDVWIAKALESYDPGWPKKGEVSRFVARQIIGQGLMTNHKIKTIQDHDEWLERAAAWFHQKWGVPKEAYTESMKKSLTKVDSVPMLTLLRETYFKEIQQEFVLLTGLLMP